jgi:hypothetical protein
VHVDSSVVIALFSGVLAVLSGVISMLARAMLNGMLARIEAIDARLHVEEKATIRQDGDLRLMDQSSKTIMRDVAEIRANMITRRDWDHVASSLSELRHPSGSRRYNLPAATAYPPAVPRSDPPKGSGGR